ncbi:hypothetical protein Dimus_008998 [Dionaea muscipula]
MKEMGIMITCTSSSSTTNTNTTTAVKDSDDQSIPDEQAGPGWILHENPLYEYLSREELQLQDSRRRLHDRNFNDHPIDYLQPQVMSCSNSTQLLHLQHPDLIRRRGIAAASFSGDLSCRPSGAQLKSELELERRAHRMTECLNKKLVQQLGEERRAKEAAERVCSQLAEEISVHKAEVERMRREEEEKEERCRMRRLALFRQQKKLADQVLRNNNNMEYSKKSMALREKNGNGNGVVKLMENPHIKRGIKGLVEFPRVVKAIGSKKRGLAVDARTIMKLECQKAQLRILFTHRSSPIQSHHPTTPDPVTGSF